MIFGKQLKQLTALTLSFAFFLAVLPAQVVAYGASLETRGLSTTADGYTTDENGLMAYKFVEDDTEKNFDVQGVFDGKWKRVTYSNDGFCTYVANGENTAEQVPVTGGLEDVPGMPGVTLKVEIAHKNSGKVLEVRYIIKNSGADSVTYSLGSSADVQIGRDDAAVITRFGGSKGFMMTSGVEEDINDAGEAAQFNLFARAAAGSAVTDVDAFWYGKYRDWSGSEEQFTFYSEDQCQEAGAEDTFDSAAAYSWKNRTLAAGAEETHIVWIGIGGPGSETEGLGGYTVDGNILKVDNTPLANATVQLCKYGVPSMGGKIVKTTKTDANGDFMLENIPDGSYTVYVTDPASGYVITTSVVVSGGEVTMPGLKLPQGNMATGTKVAAGAPSVAVKNLQDMFTPEMIALSKQPNTKVEVNLEVAPLTPTAEDQQLIEAELVENEFVAVYVDAKLVKIVTRNGVADAAEAIQPPAGQRLRMVLDLSAAAQGWYDYFVVRLHNGVATRLPATLVADGTAVEFDGDVFSTYTVGYSKTQPVQVSGGSSSGDDTTLLNESIERALSGAAKGDVISLNAHSATYITEYVMRNLRAANGVTVNVTLAGGQVLVLKSGSLPATEPGRIYWTLEELLKLNKGQSFTNPETGGIPAELRPASIVR